MSIQSFTAKLTAKGVRDGVEEYGSTFMLSSGDSIKAVPDKDLEGNKSRFGGQLNDPLSADMRSRLIVLHFAPNADALALTANDTLTEVATGIPWLLEDIQSEVYTGTNIVVRRVALATRNNM